MLRSLLTTALLVAGLAGCASAPPTVQAVPATTPWLDEAFAYDPALVKVTKEQLFALPPELARLASDPALKRGSSLTRLRYLTSLVFGPDRKGFGYIAGHSTTASETWANRAGDCLSLTVLTYAAARTLGLEADMQEVQTPMTFDRNGRFDVLNEHVNLNVAMPRLNILNTVEYDESADVVIDFDPDLAPGRRGHFLTENGILARYYNNVAVEYLTKDMPRLAYAHFRAAINADPGYATPYANLAVLYRAKGYAREPELLLRLALGMSPRPDLPLRALHQTMVEQGRHAEAQEFARQLEARQNYDPYYWTGLGLRHLQDGDWRRAVEALSRAKEIAPSFPEVRRYLAIAYARNGNERLAAAELQVFEGMSSKSQLVALRKKLIE